MILSARIQLIEEMIRENPDATIESYDELVREISAVQSVSTEDFRK